MGAERASTFKAVAKVALAEPEAVLTKLCDHLAEHGTVSRSRGAARIETVFGTARLEAAERTLLLEAEGDEETNFAYVKLSLAEHILAFAAPDKPAIVWAGDGAAGAPLPYFREMRVVGARNITPHMRRVTLAGENLARFASGGLHVRLLFPQPGAAPQWPVTGADGRPSWPDEDRRPIARVYTIRHIDVAKGEIDIDFVLHEGAETPGASFARHAAPGDVVGMTGPGGGTFGEADWYLLAGDETALPAIGRILERLPATARATVFIEVADAREEQPLPTAASATIRWLHRDGADAGGTTLLADAVRGVDWPEAGTVFAWAGCEHGAARAIRTYLRGERGLAREQHLVVAYWRLGASGDNARGQD